MPGPVLEDGSEVDVGEPARRGVARFLVLALPMMLLLYGAIYFPHRAGSPAARALTAYVNLVAMLAGGALHLFDRSVTVSGNQIGGRFPLSIILDCSALDAQALFAAAVLATRARWSDKLVGLTAGIALLVAVNLGRIATLYFVGVRAPRLFHVLHEEILQMAIVVCALLVFGAWALWASDRRDARS